MASDDDEGRAREVVSSHGGGKATARFFDARDQGSVEAAIAGCDAMDNAIRHFCNIALMRAASAGGVECLVGVVRDLKDGRRNAWRACALVAAHQEYGACGGAIDTGIPSAIAARVPAWEDSSGPGVLAPEQVMLRQPSSS
ncbi:MAG TPA: hypothetical protein VFH93_06725 [Thermoleophilia bacterium]|nr:hypothetical protein [Thermoleophilia bacterium]